MSLWKSIFGGTQAATPPTAATPTLHTLTTGQVVKFGFTAQAGVSNQRYQVVAVQTYDLGGDAKKKIVLYLESQENEISLAVVKQRHREVLELGLRVLPEQVKQLFDIEEFARIFDPNVKIPVALERFQIPCGLEGWTGEHYFQELGHRAYIADADYRQRVLDDNPEGWEVLDYALLISEDRHFGIQTEVYDGGRTEVSLLVYLPLDCVEEILIRC